MPLDLCDAVQQAGLSCPLSKGNHSISVTEEIPDLAPPVSPCGFGLLVRFCQVTKTLRSTWKLHGYIAVGGGKPQLVSYYILVGNLLLLPLH